MEIRIHGSSVSFAGFTQTLCITRGGRGSLEEQNAQLPAFCTVSASKEGPSQSLASGDSGLSQDSSVGVLSPEGEPTHFCHKHCADCPGSAWQ